MVEKLVGVAMGSKCNFYTCQNKVYMNFKGNINKNTYISNFFQKGKHYQDFPLPIIIIPILINFKSILHMLDNAKYLFENT